MSSTMTAAPMPGGDVFPAAERRDQEAEAPADATSRARPASAVDFATIYDENAPFIWRAVVRLGVRDGAVEDLVQEVFLVVHRRLPEFAGRSSLRTWIFGIAVNTVRRHRRTLVRRRLTAADRAGETDASDLPDLRDRAPDALVEKAEAVATLMLLLDELEDDQREVFVLAELEEMSVPEIAEVISVNVNTVYSRLRAARRSFDQALHRLRAREARRAIHARAPSPENGRTR